MTRRYGTKRDRAIWDRKINDLWKGRAPVLSPEDSVKAALRLYRSEMKRPWTGDVKLVSGNRYTWIRGNTLYVNPDQRLWNGHGGLREIVHLMSHYCHKMRNPGDAPHSIRQAQMERRMTKYALRYLV